MRKCQVTTISGATPIVISQTAILYNFLLEHKVRFILGALHILFL